MKSRNKFISCASLMLSALVLLPGCGADEDVPAVEMVIPSDADTGADQRPQVTLTVDNGAGVTGTVVITLVPEYAPLTVANFLAYVNAGFYDGTIFHRKDAGFVLQGGGYTAPVAATDSPTHKGTSAPIQLEIKVSNVQGTVGMARTSGLHSATSEFYINLANNSGLDTYGGGYAAFGYITNMSFVTAMTQAPCVSAVITENGNFGCLPVPNLVITSALQTRPVP
jgi:cyclophilin family peptidyl-prolyl cis-trans isomerase